MLWFEKLRSFITPGTLGHDRCSKAVLQQLRVFFCELISTELDESIYYREGNGRACGDAVLLNFWSGLLKLSF